MIAPINLHSHLCISCERPHCGCYMEPCPYRSARSDNYVCGFCRIGVQGPKPKQDALSTSEKDVSSMATALLNLARVRREIAKKHKEEAA